MNSALFFFASLLTNTALRQPIWEDRIKRDLKNGKNVLVVAHGNSLRGLVKIIDNIPDDGIHQIAIPTGIPFVYR